MKRRPIKIQKRNLYDDDLHDVDFDGDDDLHDVDFDVGNYAGCGMRS